jgi:hypothetical protein
MHHATEAPIFGMGRTAEAVVQTEREGQSYLRITAPSMAL